MKFSVKARVLLELGAELISSDAIALYELIKNAIDAASERIEVRFVSQLSRSGYQALDEDLERSETARISLAFLEENVARYFESNAEQAPIKTLIEVLTGQSIASARRKLREFYVSHTFIEVEDWGHGMSRADLEVNFMTIGTPHRAKQRKASGNSDSPILGEKGIGRLSAMRLGRILEMRSATKAEARWAELRMDWCSLQPDQDATGDLDLDEFDVDVANGERKDKPGSHGTRLRISDLQSDWSYDRISTISRDELSKLQNPFDRKSKRLDLRLYYNGVRLTGAIEEIDLDWLNHWHGYFQIDFDYTTANGERRPELIGKLKFKVPQRLATKEGEVDEQPIHAIGETAYSLIANPDQPLVKGGTEATSGRFAGIATLGSFHAEGYWFNRQRIRSELEGTGQYDAFNAWLKQWGGGLLMYRDGFRVYPYAAPDDDWLQLDQRALRRKSFKLNRGQFIGHVRISSRRNRYLVDQTNRQGLVDSPEKRALVQTLQYAIWDELGSVEKKYEMKSAHRALGSVQEIDRQVKEKSREARSKLQEITKRAPSQAPLVQDLRNYIDELELAWSRAKSTIRQQQVQADVYLHLAGVGILLEFIIHDLTRATTQTLGDLKGISESKFPPTFRSLFHQLKTLEKRLRILDPISTPGRQRKEIVDIAGVIQTLLDVHSEQFERHKIDVEWKEASKKLKFESNVVPGQMYQIFENLIANSIYWLGHQRAVNAETRKAGARYRPAIIITVEPANRTISFADNGPGIDPADSQKIFEPFFSKKPEGRGIGLYIVKSLCAENKVSVSLLDQNQRGVHPGFVFRFP